MSEQPALWEKMRALAAGDHPRAAELLEKAQAFEDATTGYYGQAQTHTPKQFLGAFVQARRLWCDITGEPLV